MLTEEEKIIRHRERSKKYYAEHKEEKAEYDREYRASNRDKINERKREYKKTPIGRAVELLKTYNSHDRKKGFEHGDLTAEWIVENIFTKPCAHCGVSGWKVIGCNRIDNSKPHTRDNVEPCCPSCNKSLGAKEQQEKIREQKNRA